MFWHITIAISIFNRICFSQPTRKKIKCSTVAFYCHTPRSLFEVYLWCRCVVCVTQCLWRASQWRFWFRIMSPQSPPLCSMWMRKSAPWRPCSSSLCLLMLLSATSVPRPESRRLWLRCRKEKPWVQIQTTKHLFPYLYYISPFNKTVSCRRGISMMMLWVRVCRRFCWKRAQRVLMCSDWVSGVCRRVRTLPSPSSTSPSSLCRPTTRCTSVCRLYLTPDTHQQVLQQLWHTLLEQRSWL